MPFRCCVPNCRGNYDQTEKVSTFSFPKNENLKTRWLKAICRQNFSPTNNSKVCEKHFTPQEVQRMTEVYCEADGKLLSAPLKHPRLVEGAVPSILPGCPSYLSTTSVNNHREAPAKKKQRIEAELLNKAIQNSIEAQREYDERITFSTIDDLHEKLHLIDLGEWFAFKKNGQMTFLLLSGDPQPIIKCSAVINANLYLLLFCAGVEIKSLSGEVRNTTQVEQKLAELFKMSASIESNFNSVDQNLKLVQEILRNLWEKLPQEKTKIDFSLEQVKHFATSNKIRLRYSWETMLFCSLLHSISPHAYKFLRSSGNITVPSISTLLRVCSNFSTDPRLEQSDENFLQYAKSKIKLLQPEDKLVVLMMDEIHLKPYLDYKGGNLVGNAFNSTECATSAHTFLINSLRSTYKDVVHILPVKTINAPMLHEYVKRIIVELEKIGFEVLGVVTDNNSINRKTMSLFSTPPTFANQYPHPTDPSRPLFHAIDSVHILKCIRNNWINKKPPYIKFPDFEDNKTMRLASFTALREMHTIEKDNLLKYGYNLTLKALYPSSIEKQNVKLALTVFNPMVVIALNELGPRKHFESYEDTAEFIKIINKWWSVVNVKTLLKGKRLRDPYQEPVTKNSVHLKYFEDFLKWIDSWAKCECDGKLTDETHWALRSTVECLMKMAKYCMDKKGFHFFLCGQVQTDKLEERFGNFRMQAGAQYHISLWQVFETESKLRMQSVVPLILKSKQFGDVTITKADMEQFVQTKLTNDEDGFDRGTIDAIPESLRSTCSIGEADIENMNQDMWPLICYVAGYASYAAIKKFRCSYCKVYLTSDDDDNAEFFRLISANDRGGMSYPSRDVIACAAYTYIVINNVLSKYEHNFF